MHTGQYGTLPFVTVSRIELPRTLWSQVMHVADAQEPWHWISLSSWIPATSSRLSMFWV